LLSLSSKVLLRCLLLVKKSQPLRCFELTWEVGEVRAAQRSARLCSCILSFDYITFHSFANVVYSALWPNLLIKNNNTHLVPNPLKKNDNEYILE
jgi:hypothetical protein